MESTIKDMTIQNIDNTQNIHQPNNKCPCSTTQLLIIVVPLTLVALFTAIFVPVYLKTKDNHSIYYRHPGKRPQNQTKEEGGKEEEKKEEEEFDEFTEDVVNVTYATLTPKNGYKNIFIFLGGISDASNKYFDFFKSNSTFVPKGTKIYFLSGTPRKMAFMDYYYPEYAGMDFPGWFNIDAWGNLVPPDDYTDAKESLELVLNEIDRIKKEENVDYKNIYLGGFSQGAMMSNYVLLNSRQELGGYIAFSGYIFDHDFPSSYVVPEENLTDVQKAKLESKKDYHILATHSFNDDGVFYSIPSLAYQTYFKKYTDFQFYSFGNVLHVLPEQPIHPIVKKWLKESMDK